MTTNITFEGNINDFQQVSYFLSIYLDEAKSLYDELTWQENIHITEKTVTAP